MCRSVSVVRLCAGDSDGVQAQLLPQTKDLDGVHARIVPREGDPDPRRRRPGGARGTRKCPTRCPRTGEVLVELRAASLNHLDVWIRKGLPSVPKPRILGADGAGVIAGTDERVVINPAIVDERQDPHRRRDDDGTHAELIALPRDAPSTRSGRSCFEEAAAFPLAFVTAWRMLVTRARLRRANGC